MAYKHRTIRSHHIIGAGAIASLMGVYHFASDNGLLGLVGYPRVAKRAPFDPTGMGGQNSFSPNNGSSTDLVPGGVPTSYNANAYGGPNANAPVNGTQYSGTQYTGTQNYPPPINPFSKNSDIRVYFSPTGGCTDAVVNELNQAQRQILIQAYSFTSEPIAKACVDAHQRGVAVFAILDKSQLSEQYSAADFLANSGVTTFIDSKHAIAHNKIMLIDGRTIITGSFNFTSAAEKSNAENLLIIRDRQDLYSAYEANLKHHYDHSEHYAGRGTGQNFPTKHR